MRSFYAKYRQHGTDTGRLASDFQQVPRVVPGEVNLRDAVRAPEGMYLLESDFSQIELRLAAAQAQEQHLLHSYREGYDVHWSTAANAVVSGDMNIAGMLLMRLGVPANRAEAEVLRALWVAGDTTAEPGRGLSESSPVGIDSEAWGWLREWGRSGAGASQLQARLRDLQTLLAGCLREVREYTLPLRTSSRWRQMEQQPLEHHDAMQILSSKGAQGLPKLSSICALARHTGKVLNLSLLYEAGPAKLAEILLLNMAEDDVLRIRQLLGVETLDEAARRLWSRWHETYPGIRRWHAREKALILKQGYAQAPHGRIKHVPKAFSWDPKERSEGLREGINHVIQSTASDLTLLAAVLAAPKMALEGALGPWPNHDSLLFAVRDPRASGAFLKEVMEVEAPAEFERRFGVLLDVPIVADVKAGERWGSLVPLDKWQTGI